MGVKEILPKSFENWLKLFKSLNPNAKILQKINDQKKKRRI